MKFTHQILWVADNKLSEKFYKKLGFEIIKSSEDVSQARLGDFVLELVTIRDEDEFTRDSMSGDKGRGVYICLQSDDVDAEFNKFSNTKYEIAKPPRDWPWGRREFVVKDPDGYKICIWQPTKGDE